MQDYAFTLELPDTGAFLRGDAIVTLRRGVGVTVVHLDLVDALAVRQVTVNDSVVSATHGGGRIDIPLVGTTALMRVRGIRK